MLMFSIAFQDRSSNFAGILTVRRSRQSYNDCISEQGIPSFGWLRTSDVREEYTIVRIIDMCFLPSRLHRSEGRSNQKNLPTVEACRGWKAEDNVPICIPSKSLQMTMPTRTAESLQIVLAFSEMARF